MNKCKNCNKEFEYPAYLKYNINLGLMANFLSPACPYCLKPLYTKILDEKKDKKVEKHEDVATETVTIEESDVGSINEVFGPNKKLDKSKSSTQIVLLILNN